MTEYKVMICTHDRPKGLIDNTLTLLERLEVPFSSVAVFVTPENFWQYKTLLWSKHWLGRGVGLFRGEPGLGANRNHAMEHFTDGTQVLSFNDDIKDMKYLSDTDKWASMTPDHFRWLVEKGFEQLDRWNAAVWGVCNLQNDLWARNLPQVQVGMPAVEGHFFGFVAGRGEILVRDTSGEFEDIERGAQVFASGKNVVKLNRYLHGQNKGKGFNTGDARETCARVRRLEVLYPRLVEHSLGRDTHKALCRPWPIRGRWVNNPVSLEDLDKLRAKIADGPDRIVDPTIHGEEA